MNMSKYLISGAALLFSHGAFGYFVEGVNETWVDVGVLDTYVADTYLKNSSEASETNWVASELGTDVSLEAKNENVLISNVFEQTGQSSYTKSNSIFAFELSTDPGYYLIKNAKKPVNTALFFNEDNVGWGVLDYNFLTSLGIHFANFNELTISHVTEFKTSMVSEPTSYALLSLGLIGLFGARRRQH